MVDRMHYKTVGLAILFLLCWMGYYPQACSGAVVWSNDFNDGNYDGWTVCENSVVNSGSTWNATNNCLYLEQDTWSSFFSTDWGVISHPSDVAYGTWSFDFKANESEVETGTFAGVEFISTNITSLGDINDWTCYWVYFEAVSISEFTIKLRKNLMTILDTADENVPVADGHHIEVTRSLGDWFSVYHNGSLIMQVQDTSTSIDTSEMFVISGQKGIMIDNIEVDNEVPPEPTTTTPTTTPTTPTPTTPPGPFDIMTIAVIGAFAVVIIAVLVVVLKRR